MGLRDSDIEIITSRLVQSAEGRACVEVRELTGRGNERYRMLAIVVPGGWVPANMFDRAYNDFEVTGPHLEIWCVRGGGMDIEFVNRPIRTTVHLTRAHLDEINEHLDALEDAGYLRRSKSPSADTRSA